MHRSMVVVLFTTEQLHEFAIFEKENHTMNQLICVFSIVLLSRIFFNAHAFTNTLCTSRASRSNCCRVRSFGAPPLQRSTLRTTHLKESITTIANDDKKDKFRVVVVGGGWAGYSFCESISTNNNIHDDDEKKSNNLEIIMLDASKQAKGGLAGGYRDESKNNRPVEAGIHGFWREYRNTFDIMDKIDGVDVDAVLGDFTPSVLYSKNGKVAVAPVLLEETTEEGNSNHNNASIMPILKDFSEESIRRLIASQLPPPLDLPVLAKLDKSNKASDGNSKLNPVDLISGLGLLGAWADFEQESLASWKRYDTQPASLLFEKAGITDALYEELVSPLLHVLPMCPVSIVFFLSATAAVSLLSPIWL